MANMAKIFTKKFAFITLAVVVALAGVIWAIVANIKPQFNSGITDVPKAYSVSGNGTSAVMVDEYLYFIGDYVATSDIKYGDNDYYANNKMPDAGIFRIKIEDGKPLVNYEYDNVYYEDGEDDTQIKHEYTEDDEEYNTIVSKVLDWNFDKNSHIEKVVPKIAGHDNAAMWVFGNTLIYTSPNNLRNGVGALRSNYLDFFKVDLNGKNNTLLYSAEVADLTVDDFTVWADDTNNVYLLLNEAGTLKKINVKSQKVTKITTDVTSVAFPRVPQYRRNAANEGLTDVFGGVMSYVYFTKSRDAETDFGKGNLMYRYQISANNEPEKIGDNDETFTLVSLAPNAFVFATAPVNSSVTYPKQYYFVTNDKIDSILNFSALLSGEFGTKEITFYAENLCVRDGVLYKYRINGNKVEIDETASVGDVAEFIAVCNKQIYVKLSNSVAVYDYDHFTSLGSVALSSDDDDTSVSLVLPISILVPAHNDGSLASGAKNLIYLHDGNAIKLYPLGDADSVYLKIKNM